MEQRPDRDLERSRQAREDERAGDLEKRGERQARKSSDADEFWGGLGLDIETMSPKAQVTTSLAVLIPVVVASAAVLFIFTNFWWFIFFFGWAIFPAFGLLLRGIAGLSEEEEQKEISGGSGKERELLNVLREHEEITPARAAMETSLSVDEADRMLDDLAAKGHLEARVRGGAIFYGLWRSEDAERRGLEEGL